MASPSNEPVTSSDSSSGHVNIISDEADDTQKPSNKKTSPRTVDDDTDFWSIYVQAAEISDKQLLEIWNKNLDSLLTFAALFSAINTAFIIESYKDLRPEPMDTTNTLLRSLLHHRNDDNPLSDTDLGFVTWDTPASAIRINSTLFSSLACSLLASFGAVLGKEMLAEYSNAVTLPVGASAEQARARHRRFDGLDKFHFHLLMRLLPALLQISLALFLAGIIDFMWLHSSAIATVFMIPAAIGLVGYLVSLIIALFYEDSPFQTSLSTSLRLVSRSLVAYWKHTRSFRTTLSTSLRQLPRSLMAYWKRAGSFLWRREANEGSSGSADTQTRSQYTTANQWYIDLLQSCLRRTCDVTNKFVDTLKTQILAIIHPQSDWLTLDQITALYIHLLDRFAGNTTGVYHTTEVLESTDCAMWLLKTGRDKNALRRVLKTFPLLPADILLKKQNRRNHELKLEPYVFIYTSGLNRRPGDVDFRWNDPRKQDAITDAVIAGTALFHVLKCRKNVSLYTLDIPLQVDPDLIEDIDQDVKSGQIDLSLLTVILCVQTQIGITRWTMELLQRLLTRYLTLSKHPADTSNGSLHNGGHNGRLSQSGSPMGPLQVTVTGPAATLSSSSLASQSEPSSGESPSTSGSTLPTIALLLDAVIFTVSDAHQNDQYESVYQRFPIRSKKMIELLGDIIHAKSSSLTVISHIAVAITAIQWYKAQYNNPGFQEYNGVTLNDLRTAWLAVDKRVTLFDNIVMAFAMVNQAGESEEILHLYTALLEAIQNFMPRTMGVSEKSESWQNWWAKVVPLIPSMLRLVNQVPNDILTAQSALRIIAHLLPNDWEVSKIQDAIHSTPVLMSLSPLDLEHGETVTRLISSVFYMAPPEIRAAAAEILGWSILYPNVDTSLRELIEHPVKGEMYKNRTGIPSFLMSMWPKPDNTSVLGSVNGYFERYFNLLLTMDTTEDSSAYTVQVEAVVVALVNSSRFRYWDVLPRTGYQKYLPPNDYDDPTIAALDKLLERILKRDTSLERPTTFILAKSDTSAVEVSLSEFQWIPEREDKRIPRENVEGCNKFTMEEIGAIWWGEWLVTIWKVMSESPGYPEKFDYFFSEDVINAVVDCIFTAIDEKNNSRRLEISFPVTTRYLQKVSTMPDLPDSVKGRVGAAMILLAGLGHIPR